MKRLSFGLALAVVLSGCASLPSSGGAGDQVEIDTHTLLGEIAFERQQTDTAAQEFLQAAMLSSEPALAERATRLAHQLEKTDVGLQAAKRWNMLAPSDERPLWFAGVFETRSNRIDRATEQFTAFMDALGDKRTGFALVLEALADEPYTDAATAIMRTLNDKFPGVPAGQYALARLALRSGDFGLALENAKAASDSDANWLEAQLLYARSLLVAGRTDESLAMGARLAEQHTEVEVQLQYAELLLSAGKPRDAEARLNAILDTNPALPEAIRALAFLAMTEERYDEAKQRFGQLRQDPRYREEAFYYLGRIAETEKDWLQATRSYARVTDGTHAVEAQRRTARIMFVEQGDQEGAVRHLHDFAEANPRFGADMLVAQSQLLLQMQRPQEAMQLFDSALAENPDDPTLHAAHVQLFVILAQDASDRGAFDEAETLLDQGLSRYADNSSLRYSQALLYEEEGKNRKAVDVLAALVKESPDDPALLNAYGYLLTDQFDRHKEARVYIQKALAKNPDSPAIIDSMGWVLFKLGDYPAAREYLERAYRLEQDPEIAAHLIDVRLALGDRDAAVELLKASLAQHPDDKHLQELGTRIGQ
ncbi:MAG TPA: tetratricopeptide repeat protein [Gammaproteobacteria bacterium]|jgi:tetratricopeptide (TPR) repeat protein|nr:tetratricopeptide repeat protein [Gammaproteobacteria bacterium]